MREEMVKISLQNEPRHTRRAFIKASMLAALAGTLPGARSDDRQIHLPGPGAGLAPPDDLPNWLTREPTRSRIVDVSSKAVLQGSVVDQVALADMLEQGVRNLTGERSTTAAWRAILGSSRKIAIKFNSVAAETLKTNEPLARVLVEQLVAAGYEARDLALVEVPSFLRKHTKTGAISDDWQGGIKVGGDTVPVCSYLLDADAVINIPFLKTHQIAGMSCCMKNLSHAVIRHPGRYHDNGCDPYVAQVIADRAVSSRLKLNIINALRVVIDRGPDARNADVIDYKGLLIGHDPLALDSLGTSILEIERRRRGLATPLNVRYLATAAEMKLGRWRASDVDQIPVKIDA